MRVAWRVVALLCSLDLGAVTGAALAAAAASRPPTGAYWSGALWWQPSPWGVWGPRPAVGMGWSSACCGWSLTLVGRGAFADERAGPPQLYPGGRLAAGWRLSGVRLELGISRGFRYRGLGGPLALADGRVMAEGAWAFDGRFEQGPLRLQAVYLPAVAALRAHHRSVMASGGGVALELDPAAAGEPGPSGRRLSAGVQWAWLEAEPQRLTFRTRPALIYQRREQAVATYLQGRSGSGLQLSAAVGLYRWFQRDGREVDAGWDGAGLLRLGHRRDPRWRLAVEAAGPRFQAPLAEQAPVSRDRILAQASFGSLAGPLKPRLEGEWGWQTSSGRLLRALGRLQLRPPWQGPGGTLPVTTVSYRRIEAQEEVGLELGLESRRWGIFVALARSGPQLAFWWATQRARLELTHLELGQGTGRLQWRWQSPAGKPPRWQLQAVYKWRPRQPDRHLYVEAAWQLTPWARLAVYVGRWDRGQLDHRFGEPSRVGVALHFADGGWE